MKTRYWVARFAVTSSACCQLAYLSTGPPWRAGDTRLIALLTSASVVLSEAAAPISSYLTQRSTQVYVAGRRGEQVAGQ